MFEWLYTANMFFVSIFPLIFYLWLDREREKEVYNLFDPFLRNMSCVNHSAGRNWQTKLKVSMEEV
jgi:hypothetical protein